MKNSTIIYSDILEEELLMKFLQEELACKLSLIPKHNLIKVKLDETQFMTAEKIAKRAKLSISEVIPSIIAKDNDAVLITDDLLIKELNLVKMELYQDKS